VVNQRHLGRLLDIKHDGGLPNMEKNKGTQTVIMTNAFYSLKSRIVVSKGYTLHPFTPSLSLFFLNRFGKYQRPSRRDSREQAGLCYATTVIYKPVSRRQMHTCATLSHTQHKDHQQTCYFQCWKQKHIWLSPQKRS